MKNKLILKYKMLSNKIDFLSVLLNHIQKENINNTPLKITFKQFDNIYFHYFKSEY